MHMIFFGFHIGLKKRQKCIDSDGNGPDPLVNNGIMSIFSNSMILTLLLGGSMKCYRFFNFQK